ncbi:MAG: hypothetical protein SF066_07045 [Thermoanaerobaculia bacterium]|nr:hypothetical protein [Thermoanaerobaculia bacterium]
MKTARPTLTTPLHGPHRLGEPGAVSPSLVAEIAALARARTFDDAALTKSRLEIHKRKLGSHRAPRDGFDALQLAQSGWAIVFPVGTPPEIREALEPLVAWRRAEAKTRSPRRFAQLEYRPGDTKVSFLSEYGAELDSADPADVPYYLLFVGSPEEIPFEFQYQLDIQYAVGRLDFERAEDYARYAEAVVARERTAAENSTAHDRQYGIFAPREEGDVTGRIHDELVLALLKRLKNRPARGWRGSQALAAEATVERLAELVGTSDFLFAGCHGWGLVPGDPLQRDCMGALLDQSSNAFSAASVPADLGLDGLLAFFFACASGGTPCYDDFEELESGPKPLAEKAFTARLPQQLLLQGAGAVLAHVGRAWTYSFSRQGARTQIDAFEDTIRRILQGHPIGHAAEIFNHRHVMLAADLMIVRELERHTGQAADQEIADLFCALRDARNFVVLGDPAVRLPVAVENLKRR